MNRLVKFMWFAFIGCVASLLLVRCIDSIVADNAELRVMANERRDEIETSGWWTIQAIQDYDNHSIFHVYRFIRARNEKDEVMNWVILYQYPDPRIGDKIKLSVNTSNDIIIVDRQPKIIK